jgi:hypothetical protein
MLNDPAPVPHRGFRNYLIVSSVVIFLAALYIGGIFHSRWQDTRALEEKAAAQRREQDQQVVQGMGGNRFEILGFYASPAAIHPGDTTDLCYSVSNAKTVTLEPQPHPVWPAFSHCVQVDPHKTITYTLTADDGTGHTKVSTVEVEVR